MAGANLNAESYARFEQANKQTGRPKRARFVQLGAVYEGGRRQFERRVVREVRTGERPRSPGARDSSSKSSYSPAPVHRLVRHDRGMFPWQTSGLPRSVDHEAHEEHEGIRERSVRYDLFVPARGASEPRSHNRSCDSAARRIPSLCPSCPSWLLQLSPVIDALSGEQANRRAEAGQVRPGRGGVRRRQEPI